VAGTEILCTAFGHLLSVTSFPLYSSEINPPEPINAIRTKCTSGDEKQRDVHVQYVCVMMIMVAKISLPHNNYCIWNQKN